MEASSFALTSVLSGENVGFLKSADSRRPHPWSLTVIGLVPNGIGPKNQAGGPRGKPQHRFGFSW